MTAPAARGANGLRAPWKDRVAASGAAQWVLLANALYAAYETVWPGAPWPGDHEALRRLATAARKGEGRVA